MPTTIHAGRRQLARHTIRIRNASGSLPALPIAREIVPAHSPSSFAFVCGLCGPALDQGCSGAPAAGPVIAATSPRKRARESSWRDQPVDGQFDAHDDGQRRTITCNGWTTAQDDPSRATTNGCRLRTDTLVRKQQVIGSNPIDGSTLPISLTRSPAIRR
jgi:hypothetical protein